jgi:chemotaxis response regulator CheB
MPGTATNSDRDLVVMGASAGGIGALCQLIGCLPDDFSGPAAFGELLLEPIH